MEDFFLGYRETGLKTGEFIKAVRIPKLSSGQVFRAYKISKRYDQDISSVIGAYRIDIPNGKVADIRVAYGGMAATPKRARAVEAALIGQDWNESTINAAMGAFDDDFARKR